MFIAVLFIITQTGGNPNIYTVEQINSIQWNMLDNKKQSKKDLNEVQILELLELN